LKRSQITRVLIEGDPGLSRKLCEQIERGHAVAIVRGPEKSLVMGKARDSVSRQPFYLGEILVTECVVDIGGTHGIGVLIGEHPERAYELAVIDAALNAGLSETKDWTDEFRAEEARIASRLKREHALVMKTKVQFDTMEESYGNR